MSWLADLVRRAQTGRGSGEWHDPDALRELARGRRVRWDRIETIVCARCRVPAPAGIAAWLGYVHFPDCDLEDRDVRFVLRGGEVR